MLLRNRYKMENEIRARKKVESKFHYGDLPDEPKDEPKPEKPQKESAYSFQNFCWFISAVAMFYYTDFGRTALYDPRIKRTWFNIGCLLIGINITIGIFFIVFLSYIKKIHSDDWEQLYPAAIPIATACFAFGTCCLVAGLWPVWGLLTPIILFVQFMGIVVLIAALPAF